MNARSHVVRWWHDVDDRAVRQPADERVAPPLVRPAFDPVDVGAIDGDGTETNALRRNSFRGDGRRPRPERANLSLVSQLGQRCYRFLLARLLVPFRLRGTFAPFFRASDRPIAIACFRLFTLRPDPLFNVPRLRRRIALSTVLLAPRLYFAIGYLRSRYSQKGCQRCNSQLPIPDSQACAVHV